MCEKVHYNKFVGLVILLSILFIDSACSFGLQSQNLAENPSVAEQDSSELVVLLHGALKSAYSMRNLQAAFQDKGFRTFNWDYNSRDYTVTQNAVKLDSILQAEGYLRYKLHFVTHSMGGIVVRYYLDKFPPPHTGRFVMIAPPNQGSQIATELREFPPFRWLYKKNVEFLTMGSDAFAPNAGIPDCEFGIIAGGTGGKYGYTWYLPGDDDSILSVEQTKLEGAEDFILLHHIHATIMMEDDTIDQTLYFIRHGKFDHQRLDNRSHISPPRAMRGIGETVTLRDNQFNI